MAQISEAAGTSFNAQGRPLSHDRLLDMFDRTEIGFDESGNLRMPTLVGGPDIFQDLQKLPLPTPEQIQRFAKIMHMFFALDIRGIVRGRGMEKRAPLSEC